MDIKQECSDYVNMYTISTPVHSNFAIREVTYQSNDPFIDSVFEEVKVKEEPTYAGEGEVDPLDDFTEQCRSQLPTNTIIIKEEVIIECQAGADYLEINKVNMDINASKNTENQVEQIFSKRRKKVYNDRQKEAVFPLEGDASDENSKKQIRTKYVDPSVALSSQKTCESIELARNKRPFQLDSSIDTKMESNNDRVTTDQNQPTPKRCKRTPKNWRKEKTFALEKDALAAVKAERTWARYSTNKTEIGNKIIYRCNNVKSKGLQCAAGVYLLYSRDATVTMFRSANKHTCGIIDPESCDTADAMDVASHEENIHDPVEETDGTDAIELWSHEEDTMDDIGENICDPVGQTGTVTCWDRKFNSKEDIDLAAIYDLDLKIVLKKYETSPTLNPSDQMTICKSIVKCYLHDNHDRKFGIRDFKRIAKAIVQRFPNEAEETYYTKMTGARARGKLYDQFQHFRGLLMSVGLATKRRKDPGSIREGGRETDEGSESETLC